MSTVVSWILLNASTLRRRRIAPTVVPLLHFTWTWSTIRVAMFLQGTFAVFGSPSASNPLGFCHVQKEARTKSGYTYTGKDCRSYASKAKGIAVKACCLHLHLPFASLRQFPSLDSCTSSESISVLVIAGPSQTPSHTSSSSIAAAEPSCSSSRPTASASSSSSTATIHTPTTSASSCSATMHTNPVSSSIQRQSTVTLAEKCRKLPYQIPRVLLRSIMTRDSCRLFGIEGAWPEFFCPEEENCALCGSSLGPVSNHPGQRSADSYLITELNPFTKIDIKVKTCTSKDCLAIINGFPWILVSAYMRKTCTSGMYVNFKTIINLIIISGCCSSDHSVFVHDK